MADFNENEELAIKSCLLAGRIMIESGAETYRVEDTMSRMAASQNIMVSHSYVTPTGIFFSLEDQRPTRMARINNRTTDLEKVALVNNVSRMLASGDYSLIEAYEQLRYIEKTNFMFPVWLQILAASIASGCFLIIFGGVYADIPAAFIAGGVGYSTLLLIHEKTRVKFFSEAVASLVIGLLAVFAVTYQFGTDLDTIIIGSVMPLVPGLVITNAIRDLMAGNFLSGLSKGAEAFLTAFAVGAGIALILLI